MAETRRVTASLFTLMWMVLGTFLNIILLQTFPVYKVFLGYLGVDRFVPKLTNVMIFTTDTNLTHLPFHTVVAATILAVLGLVLLFLSSRLDFVDQRDDPAKNEWIRTFLGFFFGVSWACFLVVEFVRAGDRSGNELLKILAAIPMVFASVPSIFVSNLYVFGCTSLFLAGLITVPRSVRAFSRRHQLTKAWSQGIRSSGFDPSAVISSFGERTSTGAEGRKLRKDADRLRQQVQVHVDRLRVVRDKLKAEVLSNDDAAAMRREADDILAKVAALNAGQGS